MHPISSSISMFRKSTTMPRATLTCKADRPWTRQVSRRLADARPERAYLLDVHGIRMPAVATNRCPLFLDRDEIAHTRSEPFVNEPFVRPAGRMTV